MLWLLAILASSCAQTYRSFVPLPVGNITPHGWLLDRLEAQARGLDGSLDKWWPQVSKSLWTSPHGNATVPGLRAPSTERVPYWLNGMVPLHALLHNANASSPEAISTGASCSKYIAYILDNQNPESGWLGPNKTGHEDVFWPRYYLLMALRLRAESAKSSHDRATLIRAMLRHVHASDAKMAAQNWPSPKFHSPGGISKIRVQDYLSSLVWLLAHAPASERSFLAAHAATVLTVYRDQVDWEQWFASLPTGGPGCRNQRVWNKTCLGRWGMHTHGVSSAMALKSAAVLFELGQGQNGTLRRLSLQRMHDMDVLYGSALGLTIADESYPAGPLDRCVCVRVCVCVCVRVRVLGGGRSDLG